MRTCCQAIENKIASVGKYTWHGGSCYGKTWQRITASCGKYIVSGGYWPDVECDTLIEAIEISERNIKTPILEL